VFRSEVVVSCDIITTILIINNLFLYLLCKTGTKVISKQTVYQLILKLSQY
jgi:hypothetical protein